MNNQRMESSSGKRTLFAHGSQQTVGLDFGPSQAATIYMSRGRAPGRIGQSLFVTSSASKKSSA